jgi:glycosyltransferase involved in cell wall biosynthesis
VSSQVFLVSDATATCGVEEFARQAAQHSGGTAVPLGQPLPDTGGLVINLPIVAWKRRLLAPIVAATRARLSGRSVTLVLHEWADLALARRIAYLPLLPLATRVFFSSPEVMAQFDATPVSRMVTKGRRVIAIPPNFTAPEWTASSALSESMAADRARGKFVLAQFGSIYPKKDPFQFLAAAAELAHRDVDVRAMFIGSFVGKDVEADFWAETYRLGLDGRVEVTGYIQSAAELYGVFAEVDAFLYPLSEGLTSRRASVQAAALAGRPVIVTAPERRDSLDHHALLKSLIAGGIIQFAPWGADAVKLADAVLATRGLPVKPLSAAREIGAVWRDVVDALDA